MVRAGLALALIALAASSAAAQEFRGSIVGHVKDTSDLALPGVTVTATNVATNVASTTVSNNEGNYTIAYLTPGNYRLTAELSGFKKFVRERLEVRVGDRLTLDLTMAVGSLEETVTVTAQSPLLETGSASAGQVIDEKRIALMPLSDGNPFVLARLVPGVAYTGDLKFSRPFDNAGTSSITADGSSGGNEFTLDGSPNMANKASGVPRVAYVPPAGAVSEFKVSTASFDAADGHTAGAMVNVTLKSGTNQFKGDSYYYKRSDKLSATDFFVKKAGGTKPSLKYDRPGGSLGGLIDRNRTFFFGAVEWLYDQFPEPGPRTVPSAAMRNGDFSALLAQNIIIYDPATAQLVNGRVVRTPFAGNIIPSNRINPIAAAVLKYFPLPNQAGDAQGRNNYFSINPRSDDFYSIATRVDHRISEKQQVFVRYTRNDRRESRNAFFGEVNGVVPTGNFLFRKNDGVTYDHVYTMSPSALLDVRAGWQRFQEPNVRQHEGIFDPASLGFPSSVTSLFGGAKYFPHIDCDLFTAIDDQIAATTVHSIYSFQPTLTRIVGNHSIRTGYDRRMSKEFGSEAAGQAGEYVMRNNSAFTRAQDNSAGVFGQDLATFMLGLPTSGTLDRNTTRLDITMYHGLFVQDDWKVSNRLTLNLGLRYDYESATYDTQNRNARGFDPTATLDITAPAQARYAANPIPQLPASAFAVRGGLQFASDSARGFWHADNNGCALTTGGGNQAGEIELTGIPARYLSTSRQRDQATIDFLSTLVANPFQGLLPGTSFNGATIARSQLVHPFPQFGNIRTFDDDGTSVYNSAQVKLEKRFTTRFSALAAYTWSRFTERVFQLNPTDPEYENRLSQFDVPHRLSISGIWQLPWGFSVQGIGQFQSGQPISFHDRNIYFNGDLASLKTDYSGDTNQPVFDISGFYFHDAAVQTNGVDDPAKQRADQRIRLTNNLRYFPSRIDGLRGQRLNLWDLSIVKQLPIKGRVRAQLHAEFLNAFNRAVFANPNTDPTSADFGKVTSQNNLPRDIQLAVKLVF